MSIQTVKQRSKLAARREPYWHLLASGQHLGFRSTEDGGHWIARAYDPGSRARTYKALGDFRALPDSDRFDAAAAAAREWFEHVARGGTSATVTVRDAFLRYIEHTRKRKGSEAAAECESRFQRHIAHDAIASIDLLKLTSRHIERWRDRLAAMPAQQPKRGPNCRVKTDAAPARLRSASTINRDMVPLRAALNLAKRERAVTTDAAWASALAPQAGADGRRDLYIDRAQRRAVLAELQPDIRAFVQGLALLPLRPGALAGLRVKDFDARAKSLRIHGDKAGAGRSILLPDEIAALMREQANGKLPGASLFARWDGKAWDKDAWKKPISTAVRAAGLPAGATAYTFRHSTITDLVTGGLDLFTVATLSGTSVAMIEKHYGHLQKEHARNALAGLNLGDVASQR